jgi:hypothetical protein
LVWVALMNPREEGWVWYYPRWGGRRTMMMRRAGWDWRRRGVRVGLMILRKGLVI